MMQRKILITGGSGMIGRAVTHQLLEKGSHVNQLSRKPMEGTDRNLQIFFWNIEDGYADPMSIGGVTDIIHLAGENIGEKRWTAERRRKILSSRTESIRLIFKLLRENPDHQVRSIISASASGYYGDRGDQVLTEDSGPGNGFLSETVLEWEKAVQEGKELGLRVVMLRCGIVLNKDEGALPQLERPIRAGFGAALGTGKQWVPWIHIGDLAALYLFLLTSEHLQGPFNACAPEQVTNERLTQEVRKRLGWSIPMPNVPALLLKAALGKMSELVLASTRMSSYRIEAAGFTYRYPTIQQCLDALYN
jgi:uncharacterized protein (TIGR01777 family)